MAEAPHHEAQGLALLGIQRIEEVGEGGDDARAGSAQCIELGIEQLLRGLARELLPGDEAGQLGAARQALQGVALPAELPDPGGEPALLLVVQVQLGGDACHEMVGEAVSVRAERMAMAAVAEVVMVKTVMRLPATKEVHGVLSGALEARGWDGRHLSREAVREHLGAVSPGFVLYRPGGRPLKLRLPALTTSPAERGAPAETAL